MIDGAHVGVKVEILKKRCFVVLIRRELPSMFPVKPEEKKNRYTYRSQVRRDKLIV